MSEIKVFESVDFGNLRVIEENGKMLFVASDVAKMLGYSNPSKAISDHCRYIAKRYIPHPQGDSTLEVNTIPEGDVYRLIARSKLPAAERFESWVFDEVLPSIRKTGGYQAQTTRYTPATAVNDVDDAAAAIERVFKIKHGMALAVSIELTEKVQQLDLSPLRPLLPPADNPSFLNPTVIGERLGGLKPSTVNKMLWGLGLQYKSEKGWRLTDDGFLYGEEKPYTRNGHSGYQIAWSEKVMGVLR